MLNFLKKRKLVKAAESIQCGFRMAAAKRTRRRLQDDKKFKASLRLSMIVQRHWRGMEARKSVHILKAQQKESEFNTRTAMASKLQQIARGFVERAKYRRIRDSYRKLKENTNKSARIIQRWWRKIHSRLFAFKMAMKRKAEKVIKQKALQWLRKEKSLKFQASCVINMAMKCYRARKKMKVKRQQAKRRLCTQMRAIVIEIINNLPESLPAKPEIVPEAKSKTIEIVSNLSTRIIDEWRTLGPREVIEWSFERKLLSSNSSGSYELGRKIQKICDAVDGMYTVLDAEHTNIVDSKEDSKTSQENGEKVIRISLERESAAESEDGHDDAMDELRYPSTWEDILMFDNGLEISIVLVGDSIVLNIISSPPGEDNLNQTRVFKVILVPSESSEARGFKDTVVEIGLMSVEQARRKSSTTSLFQSLTPQTDTEALALNTAKLRVLFDDPESPVSSPFVKVPSQSVQTQSPPKVIVIDFDASATLIQRRFRKILKQSILPHVNIIKRVYKRRRILKIWREMVHLELRRAHVSMKLIQCLARRFIARRRVSKLRSSHCEELKLQIFKISTLQVLSGALEVSKMPEMDSRLQMVPEGKNSHNIIKLSTTLDGDVKEGCSWRIMREMGLEGPPPGCLPFLHSRVTNDSDSGSLDFQSIVLEGLLQNNVTELGDFFMIHSKIQ